MQPGHRVDLLRAIASRLTEVGWSDGDLILQQFGLPTSDWRDQYGGNREYAFGMMREASDEQLNGLAEYFGLQSEPVQSQVWSQAILGYS